MHSQFSVSMNAIGYFEPHPVLAVAISGGPDSMALLHLCQHWAKAQAGQVIALTVDHGLRQESSEEACQVAGWCKALGITHHILAWEGSKPASGIQEAARAARYKLLTEWCKAHQMLHLLTAHHRDDQAETLLLRLARGSGMEGLAGLALYRLENGVRLIRPLLGYTKGELIQFLQEQKQVWLEDASNQKSIYTRNFLRTQVTSDAVYKQAADLADSFGSIRKQLEYNIVGQLTNSVSIYPEGYGTIDYEALKAMHQAQGIRLLTAVILTISGGQTPPRSEKLSRLWQELTATLAPKRRTFGGCLLQFIPKRGLLLVTREPKAIEPPLVLKGEISCMWDSRFSVECQLPNNIPYVMVKPVTPSLLAGLRKQLPAGGRNLPPKAALFGIPSFWVLEELAAIPHIGYHHPRFASLACQARFRAVKALAGALFCGMSNRVENSQQERA